MGNITSGIYILLVLLILFILYSICIIFTDSCCEICNDEIINKIDDEIVLNRMHNQDNVSEVSIPNEVIDTNTEVVEV